MADTATTTTSEVPWRDDDRPLAERVELLLEAMTLEEKVAQLGSRWVGNDMADSSVPEGSDLNVAPLQDVFAASGTVPLEEASRHGLGHLTRVYGSVPVTVEEGVAELVRQHRVVLSGSRLGIPALVHEECLTGFTAYGATVYPAAIAWGATWDPALVERMALAIGRDMAALGVHQGLSPVLDVVRDYRWGRVEETMGEDPYLVSVLGTAYVRGLQEMGVSATLKHFAAYSASRAARNHGPVSMGPREMADVMLPPFEAAIALGGADSVMNSYSDIDGVPAGASTWLLTEVLRDEWGFDGTVVSDYWAIPFLATHAPRRRRLPGGGRGRARCGDRRGAAGHPGVRRGARRPGPRGGRGGSAGRPGRPPAAARQGTARPARRRLDPRGLGARRRRRRPRLTGQPGAGPGDGRALDRAAGAGHRAAAGGGGAPGGASGRRRRPVCRRPDDVHGLLRLPEPRAAPASRRSGWASRCRRHWRPCVRSCPGSSWSTRPAAP